MMPQAPLPRSHSRAALMASHAQKQLSDAFTVAMDACWQACGGFPWVMRLKLAAILSPLTTAGWPQLKSDFFVETGDLSILRDLKRFFDALSITQPKIAYHAMREIIDCLHDEAHSAKAHYNPNQLRVPAGSSDGGQWSDGNGRSGTPTQRRPDADTSPKKARLTVHTRNEITIHHADGKNETRKGGSQAWRNNNPGNVVYGSFAERHGAIGKNGVMAVFPNPETGKNADRSLLKGPDYRRLTLNDAIAKRSPPFENDTQRLQEGILKRSKLPRNRVIENLSEEEFDRFTEAIYHFEGWKEGQVTLNP